MNIDMDMINMDMSNMGINTNIPRLNEALSQIDTHLSDARQLWFFGQAMIRGYANRYPSEKFRVIHIEKPTHGDIINPRTGSPSRAVMWSQKCDGVIQMIEDDSYWLLEHKTASVVNANYVDKIWEDPQIFTYSDYLRRVEGIPIKGILYNVLVKPSRNIKQREGESDEEYAIRYAEACAKAKSGKSSAKQKMAESDDEFAARLDGIFSDPSMYWRTEILVNERQINESRQEKWNIIQYYLQARRSGYWLRNRSQCKPYPSVTCDYWNLCSCKPEDEESVINTFYQMRAAHEELSDHISTIPESEINGRTIFSHSRCVMLLNCPKRHWFRYERGIVPIAKSDNLTFGSAVHAALEVWHGGGSETDSKTIQPINADPYAYSAPF